jgi:hypothetical protein
VSEIFPTLKVWSQEFIKKCAKLKEELDFKVGTVSENAENGNRRVGFPKELYVDLTSFLREQGFTKVSNKSPGEEWFILMGFAIGWYERDHRRKRLSKC